MIIKKLSAAVCLAVATPSLAVTNISIDPGFEGTETWSTFGAAGFNDFFGGNRHASLFPDFVGNTGGIFQVGIPAMAGTTYQFDLLNTRIESSYDAVTRFGFEFYAPDDETKLGESLVVIDAAERLALPNVDGGGGVNGAVFSTKATAPVGTAFARPIVSFDDVNLGFFEQPQANVFVFDSFVSEVPALGGNLLKNPDFGEDVNQDGNVGDVWGTFGNAGINDFFGGNLHGSLFADTAGNSGGLFQQSILAEDGANYEFELTDVRIESAFDARIQFGLEYYGTDDFTLLGSDLVTADTSTPGDGLSFSMQATPVDGTVFVRPIVLLDNVNPAYSSQPSANAFVFATSLSEAIASGLPGDANGDGSVDLLDLDILGANFGTMGTGTVATGDFNGDTNVDLLDLDILGANFGTSINSAAVPEPATIVAALLGIAAVAVRRSH
ncbi:MAG: hypothetical protein AAF266_09945 [Planctomycetota bacterium]